MTPPDFSQVRHWVFDLDNTLYPPDARLFDQIEVLMHEYVMRTLDVSAAEAHDLRIRYWRDHGATLRGLMLHHDVDADGFLADVHDIDLAHLTHDEVLGAAISALPGRRIVYTNGSRMHAHRVIAARGLHGIFDDVYGLEDAHYVPKPDPRAYEAVFASARVDPATAVMFEDEPRNLDVPRSLGMRTVLVTEGIVPEPAPDHVTDDLSGFLSRLVADAFQ